MGNNKDFQLKLNDILKKEEKILEEKNDLLNQINQENLYVNKKNHVQEHDEVYAIDYRINYNQRYFYEFGMFTEDIYGLLEITKEEFNDIQLLLNEFYKFFKKDLNTTHPYEVFKKLQSQTIKKYTFMVLDDMKNDMSVDEQKSILIKLFEVFCINRLKHTNECHFYEFFTEYKYLEYNKDLSIYQFNYKSKPYRDGENEDYFVEIDENLNKLNPDSYIRFIKTQTSNPKLNTSYQNEGF